MSLTKKKVLITGATGFLGSNLSKRLLQEGYEVIALIRKTSDTVRIDNIINNLNVCYCEDDLENIFIENKLDVIIHTATCYGRSGESEVEILTANTLFPLKLISLAKRYKVDAFINTGTTLNEYMNLYTLSKHHFKEWGINLSNDKQMKFINIRLEHMYGANDAKYKFTTFVIDGCANNISELPLTKGEQERDFIYIDDVVSCYSHILKIIKQAEGGFTEFSLGSGSAISIRDFSESVKKVFDSKTKLIFGSLPYRENELMFSEADISKLKKTGWMPKVSLKEALEKIKREYTK